MKHHRQLNEKEVQRVLREVPEEQRGALAQLRAEIVQHLPEGFQEMAGNGAFSYVVPLDRYPRGYHATPGKPLPFLELAARKSHLALYHFGLYADKELLAWWKSEYARKVPGRLDMGKSCIRFKKWDQLPLELIGELCAQMSVEKWITVYEMALTK